MGGYNYIMNFQRNNNNYAYKTQGKKGGPNIMANLVDLSNLVAEKMDITKKDSKEVVQTVFDTISELMVSGESVKIAGFGAFEKVDKEARTARNPKTGEPVPVPAHGAVRFKPSSILKDALK